MRPKTIEALARLNHINNAMWAKLGRESLTDFSCQWEELTEYQRELYIAGIELLICEYRRRFSPVKWLWRLYYKYHGW